MKDAQKPDHVGLTTLVGRLKEGRFVIPDFQRDFEWQPWDIGDLMRSIFLDYYVGSLLLWKSKAENFDALSCESIYGYGGQGNPEHIVLDGQQRLTAMYYAFVAPDVPAPSRANRYLYFIRVDRFTAGAYDEAFTYDWTSRGVGLLENKVSQYNNHMFPLSVIGQGGWALPNWVQDYERHWSDRADETQQTGDEDAAQIGWQHASDARAFGEHLKGITEQYQIAYIELDRDLELDKVCDIFTQINSRGVRLDVFDLVNALLKPKGLQLKHMWRKAEPRLNFVETERMNVYVLEVMSILQQAYCSPKYLYYLLPGQEKSVRDPDGGLRKEILVRNISDFEKLWVQAVDALERAISLLRQPHEFGVISSGYLPYVAILPAFAALQSHVNSLPAKLRFDGQRKIRHWYWASVFTNRYSGSVESTSARDFLAVKAWIEEDSEEPVLISEFAARFRSLDLRKEVRRGTSVYNGIFNLFVIRDARDWVTGNVPQHDDLDDHHIVPKDWGKKEAVGSLIDSILNRTPLTAETNRNVIGNRLPNIYLPEMIESIGEIAVKNVMGSHFISAIALEILLRDPFTPADFDVFLAERQRTIQEAIATLLVKERLDLSPQLRELDERVEGVELGLRRMISAALGNDASRLPSHVQAKINERLDASAKKNPALDRDHYGALLSRLEYSDLRELQDTMTSKSLWTEFEGHFHSKETLAGKFGQLAELRNRLRHSGTVDDITRKEGEAALLWFEQTLAKTPFSDLGG
ncbi:MAG: GmrSD restriction endonuclease domain-containing protein [Chloroflexota bacterium]